jgi:hypothetical protein
VKRGFKLIILAVVLVLLAGAYIILKGLDLNGEKEAEATPLLLKETAQGDITSLGWSYAADKPVFVKSDTGWRLEGDDKFPVKQSEVDDLAAKLVKLEAEQAVTVSGDISDYGLDAPGLTVSYKTTDGTENTLVFGDVNSLTGDYYATLNGDNSTVYLINSELPKAFMLELKSLLSYETVPDAAFENVSSFTVTSSRGSKAIVYLADNGGLSYTGTYKRFLYEDDKYYAVDDTKAKNIISKVTAIDFTDCVSYDATEAELESYGLSEPALKATVEFNDADGISASYTLEFGGYKDESCYVRLEGSSMVYLADAAIEDSLALLSYESLRPDDVCLMDWDTVDRMDISLKGKTYTVNIASGHTTDADGKDLTTRSFTSGDKLLDAEKGQALLDAINKLKKSGEASVSANRGEQIAISFHRNTATFKEMTLTLYMYDSSSSLVSFNGETRLLVSSESVNELVTLAEELLG